MKLIFLPMVQRVIDAGSEYAYYGDASSDTPTLYDQTESDIINSEIPQYRDDSFLYPQLSTSDNDTTVQKSAVLPANSPWLGSIHSLVNDASTLLLATKGVAEAQLVQGHQTGVYNATQGAVIANSTGKKTTTTAKNNTATFVAIGIVALLVVITVIVLMKKAT